MCDQQSLRLACAYAQSMTVKLLNEHHLEFLSLKWGCSGSSESTIVKMGRWKSCVTAHIALTGLAPVKYENARCASPLDVQVHQTQL